MTLQGSGPLETERLMRRGCTCFFVFFILLSFSVKPESSGVPYSARADSIFFENLSDYTVTMEYDAENALYFIGDTSNLRCSTVIPMRLNLTEDTNYWCHNVLWANFGDWGDDDPWDSIRISRPCATESEWLDDKDASIMMHYSCIEILAGFPPGEPGSPKIWCVGTPLSIVGDACEEDVHVFATSDLWNVTNRTGPDTGDTIANPLFLPCNIIIDTVFWYLQTGQNGIDSFYTFYDSGRYVPESVLVPEYDGADTIQTWLSSVHTADPRLLIGADGDMYVFFQAAFAGCWWRGGHYNCVKPGAVYAARSSDGRHWRDLTRITHLNGGLASPAPIIDSGGTAVMWMAAVGDIEADYHPGQVYRFASAVILPDTGYWPPPIACIHNFSGNFGSCTGEKIWHIGVKADGGADRLMVFNTTAVSCRTLLGICKSHDGGVNWDCQPEPLLATNPGHWDGYAVYAPELMAWDGTKSGWLLFYSGHDKIGGKWRAAFTPLLAADSAEAVRGDANHDGFVNVGDAFYLVNFVFRGGPAPNQIWTGDANCDSGVDVGDVVFLISYIFKLGPPPDPDCASMQ
jgi:hypothetical protein